MFTEKKEIDTINHIKEIILQNNEFVIISHTNPDGDAIGSSFALYNTLINMNKKAQVIIPNDCPDFLKWIAGYDSILLFQKQKKQSIEAINKAQVIIMVDFNSLERIEDIKPFLENNDKTKIIIDHHPNPNTEFINYIISEPSASSASELVYRVLYSAGFDNYIDKNVAESIYIGIITDTGNLTHNSSNPLTYQIIGNLLKKGINKSLIHELTFNVNSASRLMLLGKLLSQNMKILTEYSTAYMYITLEDQKKYNFTTGDSEGFVNYPLSIKGIKFCALFTENEDVIKISFRSKHKIPANLFSQKHFNGGGHLNAAGGRIKLSLNEALTKFEEHLPEFKEFLI
ncbi:MAG: bifunctional oligoribonuclease/PAP phosphatase NrnA [Bacteroidales bacterium]|nr:bifunctional oligoribonuclease/PAP phosphatase NrnA [Bacteroidales bacterium]